MELIILFFQKKKKWIACHRQNKNSKHDFSYNLWFTFVDKTERCEYECLWCFNSICSCTSLDTFCISEFLYLSNDDRSKGSCERWVVGWWRWWGVCMRVCIVRDAHYCCTCGCCCLIFNHSFFFFFLHLFTFSMCYVECVPVDLLI